MIGTISGCDGAGVIEQKGKDVPESVKAGARVLFFTRSVFVSYIVAHADSGAEEGCAPTTAPLHSTATCHGSLAGKPLYILPEQV